MPDKLKFLALLLILSPIVILAPTFFSTTPKVMAATTRVDLLTADNFAVLAGQHISDVPTSTIIGDVGLSPAAGSFITGLTTAEVTGTIFAVDSNGPAGVAGNSPGLLTQAKNDLTTAYTDAANRTPATVLSGSDNQLGGQTLTAGIYSFGHATSANLTAASPLTLNGQGDPNAVFIFQASSDLVMASASLVQLTGSAQACNVFWQVGSSAILGTGSNFVGNILALTDITDNGGSTINGRLLARNNDVVLNNTTITKPTCAAAVSSSSGSSTSSGSGGGSSETATPPLSSDIIPPTIVESRRVDEDSVFISWSPFSGVDTFNVRYGLTNGEWLFNTNVTGFSTTINNLPPGQPIWFQVAARNASMIGTYGPAKLAGGPILPGAGIDPNTILWFIPSEIFILTFLFFVLILTRYKKSSF